MSDTRTGGCLCSAVRFTTRGPVRGIIYCHCVQCRRQSGHIMAATAVADRRIVIEGRDNLTWFAASPQAKRGFCRTCGSLLFWKGEGLDRISVTAGAFDEPTGLTASHHIYAGEKGDYYEITDGLPAHGGNGGDPSAPAD